MNIFQTNEQLFTKKKFSIKITRYARINVGKTVLQFTKYSTSGFIFHATTFLGSWVTSVQWDSSKNHASQKGK